MKKRNSPLPRCSPRRGLALAGPATVGLVELPQMPGLAVHVLSVQAGPTAIVGQGIESKGNWPGLPLKTAAAAGSSFDPSTLIGWDRLGKVGWPRRTRRRRAIFEGRQAVGVPHRWTTANSLGGSPPAALQPRPT